MAEIIKTIKNRKTVYLTARGKETTIVNYVNNYEGKLSDLSVSEKQILAQLKKGNKIFRLDAGKEILFTTRTGKPSTIYKFYKQYKNFPKDKCKYTKVEKEIHSQLKNGNTVFKVKGEYRTATGKESTPEKWLKQYKKAPLQITKNEKELFEKIQLQRKKYAAQKPRIKIRGKFVGKQLTKFIEESAERNEMTVEQYVEFNEEDLDRANNNLFAKVFFISSKMEELILNYKGKIEVLYTTTVDTRDDLLKIITNFKSKMIAPRKEINVADLGYFVKFMFKGGVLRITIHEIPYLIEATDDQLNTFKSDHILLFIS